MKTIYVHDSIRLETEFGRTSVAIQVVEYRLRVNHIEFRWPGKSDWHSESSFGPSGLAEELWRSKTVPTHTAIYFEEVTK